MLSASLTLGGLLLTTSPADARLGVSRSGLAPKLDLRPNIVIVLTDDMRADDLDYMSATGELVGRAGARFTGFISPHPLCCPARAEILTGQYAQNNGVHHNRGLLGGYSALDPSATLATWLQAAGYRTAMHGKHLNSYRATRDGRDPGWDVWDPIAGAPVYDYKDFSFYDGDAYVDDYVTTRLAERSESTIRTFAAANDPFLVMVNHIAPHQAFGPSWPAGGTPPPAEEQYATAFAGERSPAFDAPSYNEADVSDKPRDLRRPGKVDRGSMQRSFLGRVRALQSVDDAVESLLETLRQTGELENTYVFFTSDNGYALGEHRYVKKNRLSREVLSVPLLVAGPGVDPGTRIPAVTTLVDLSATVLDIADATPTLPIDGQSLLGLLHGEDLAWRDTTLVQTGSESVTGAHPGWWYRGVQTKRYLYGVAVNEPRNELLYDRVRDPGELENVAGSRAYRQVRAELRDRARELMGCSGPECNQRFGRLPRPAADLTRHVGR